METRTKLVWRENTYYGRKAICMSSLHSLIAVTVSSFAIPTSIKTCMREERYLPSLYLAMRKLSRSRSDQGPTMSQERRACRIIHKYSLDSLPADTNPSALRNLRLEPIMSANLCRIEGFVVSKAPSSSSRGSRLHLYFLHHKDQNALQQLLTGYQVAFEWYETLSSQGPR